MIADRLRSLRKELNLTQQQFAEALSLKQNTIASYEIGRSEPSDRTISDICRVYNVNKEWLLNGEGEMFRRVSREAAIAAWVGATLKDETAKFQHAVLYALKSMDADEWQLLEKAARTIHEEYEKADQ